MPHQDTAVLTHPTIRNDDPNPFDWGVVSRVITGITAPLSVDQVRPVLGVKTTVLAPADTSPVLLAAANFPAPIPPQGGRRGLSIFNFSRTRFLHVQYTPVAITPVSPTSFTARVPPMSLYTLPWPSYTGDVSGSWSLGAGPGGYALVTETF
jgi:hypothetical protein